MARESKWLLLFKIILKFSNSLCFAKIFKFPVFSLSGITFHNFPCAVGTLIKDAEIFISINVNYFSFMPFYIGWVEITLSCTVEEVEANLCLPFLAKIQNGRQF